MKHSHNHLTISAAAIEVVAATLGTQDPLSAVMAGLRAHNGNVPFHINQQPVHGMNLIGCGDGAWIMQTARAYVHAASWAGFRSIVVSHTTMGPFGFFHQDKVMTQSATITQAMGINLYDQDGFPAFTRESIAESLHTALEDPSIRQVFLIKPFFQKEPRQHELDLIREAVLHALISVNSALRDVVVVLEDGGYDRAQLDCIKAHAGGVINAHHGTAETAGVGIGDFCLFARHALPETKSLEPGENLVGTYGDDPQGMPKIIEEHVGEPAHELPENVIAVINKIHAEPQASDLTYIQRLELVSRACGYRNWHAAQSQGRGVFEKMQRFFVPQKAA